MRLAAADPTADLSSGGLHGLGDAIARAPHFVPAPAFDDEHPEELSYRPFPIAPYLTSTASVDDPALARMVHPDLRRTLELLDQALASPPMRLRPWPQAAQLMWAQQFKGEAVDLSSFSEDAAAASGALLANRKVVTQAQ
jgi:hypothetical protein